MTRRCEERCPHGRSRAYVQRAIFDRFMEKFLARTAEQVVGDPLSAKTNVGALVTKEHREQVKGLDKGVPFEPTVIMLTERLLGRSVGHANRAAMAELGESEVRTLLHSGNIVVTGRSSFDPLASGSVSSYIRHV
jgi:hypothetical protein